MIRLNPNPLFYLRYRNRRGALQDLCELTVVIGREVQDHHIRHSAVGRHVREEISECLNATGGSADADHQKILFAVSIGWFVADADLFASLGHFKSLSFVTIDRGQ